MAVSVPQDFEYTKIMLQKKKLHNNSSLLYIVNYHTNKVWEGVTSVWLGKHYGRHVSCKYVTYETMPSNNIL